MERILDNDNKDVEIQLNNDMNITNKLLLDMVQNQKMNIKSLVKMFVMVIICYTILLLSMVIGFFIYESQFETLQTVTTQEADTMGGDAIINGSGEMYYGESTSDNSK